MAIYTFDAVALTINWDGSISSADTVDIVVDITPSNFGAGFYIFTRADNTTSPVSSDTYDQVQLVMEGDVNSVTIDGVDGFPLFEGTGAVANFSTMVWDNGSKESTVLYLTDNATNTLYYIAVEGDPLPNVTSSTSGRQFLMGISERTGDVPGGYAFFNLVPFENMVGVTAEYPGAIDLIGTQGNDTLTGDGDSVLIEGLGGDDSLTGSNGDDTINGGAGDDSVIGGPGADSLSGGDGNDIIAAGLEDVFVDGGEGIDTYEMLNYDVSGAITVDLASGVIDAAGVQYAFTGFENAYLYLNSLETTLDATGTVDANYFYLFSGNSTVEALDGDDTVLSFIGDDHLMGGSGNDFLDSWAGNDTLDGGDGNDALRAGSGDDVLTGGLGQDFLSGDTGNDILSGGEDADSLDGGDGDDTLDAGLGDDFVYASLGADMIEGGDGYDILSFANMSSRIIFDLNNSALNFGEAADDTATGFEEFHGSDFIDQLRGDSGDNALFGGASTDRLYGRAGDDILNGEAGFDAIFGNLGADVMTGGDDTQRDRFIYFKLVESGVGAGNRDVITDFTSGEDRIEISRFDADTTQGFKQRFTFVADAGLSGVAGELTYVHEGSNTIVQADVNGDGLADFEIELTGLMDLVLEDFYI